MYGLILTLHILVCLLLILVVLLQTSKGAGLGGIFGGTAAESIFSTPSGTVFIKKLTIGIAIAFFCTTALLTVLHNRRTTQSVLQRVPIQQGQ